MRKAYCVNGRHQFVIDFQTQADGTIKIYAPIAPADPHGKSASTHHLFADREICVAADRKPRSMAKAEAIAKYWAERYAGYLETGTFSDTGAKVNV